MRRKIVAAVLAISAVTSFGGCGPLESLNYPHYHFLYSKDVTSPDNPFPDARLITPDGMQLDQRKDWYAPFLGPKALTPEMRNLLASATAAAAELHGANNLAPTLMRGDIGEANGGAVHRLVKRGDHYEVLERNLRLSFAPRFMLVRPSVPMPSGADGLLVFTSGFRTSDEYDFERPPDFENEEGADKLINDAAEALHLNPFQVQLVLPVHAQETLPTMQALADFTSTAPAPAYAIPPHATLAEGSGTRIAGVWTPADPDWAPVRDLLERHPFNAPASDVGQVISGTFKARDVRVDGVFAPELVANPSSAPEVDLWFTLVLPKGPKPAGGYKVVIGGHGFKGRNTVALGDRAQSFCADVGELLAQRGLGCLGIDAPSHGTRGDPNEFWAGDDFRKTRDAFRQMAFEQMQLAKLATVIDADQDGTPDLSPEIGYLGTDLGGITGANVLSFDPRVKFGALNAPGAGLASILSVLSAREGDVGPLAVKTGLTVDSDEYESSLPFVTTVAQLFLDSADPANLAEAFQAHPERAVLLQQGAGDGVITNASTGLLAKAMGAPATDVPMSGTVRALTTIDPKASGLPTVDPHDVLWEVPFARTQVVDFVTSGGSALTVE